MRINAFHFQPYIYNTNYLNRNSMNKISSISDDVLSSKTDFSKLTDEDLNQNPLRKGETSHFADVLQRQFQMGQMNASRLIKSSDDSAKYQAGSVSAQNQNPSPNMMQRAIEAYQANMAA